MVVAPMAQQGICDCLTVVCLCFVAEELEACNEESLQISKLEHTQQRKSILLAR